jgi:hypothetical protein
MTVASVVGFPAAAQFYPQDPGEAQVRDERILICSNMVFAAMMRLMCTACGMLNF